MFRLFVALVFVVLYVDPAHPTDEPTRDTDEVKRCGQCCEIDFDNCPLKDAMKDKWIICQFTNYARDRPGKGSFYPKNIDPELCTHIYYGISLLDKEKLVLIPGNPDNDIGKAMKDKWIICQFTNYARDRPGKGSFYPKNIDPELCTHIYYGISLLDKEKLVLIPGNPDNDIGKDFFKQVTDLKVKGPKVMLIIAIYYDDKWRMAFYDQHRLNFVTSVVKILEKHNFDGVDLSFSSTACPLGNLNEGQESHDNHVKLFKDLRAAFNGKYLLSVDLPTRKSTIDGCFSMEALSELADWVNLSTYQYHSWNEMETGAQAPMCGPDDVFGVFNTLNFYMDNYKYSPDKVTLGIPFYGSTFQLEKENGIPKFGDSVSAAGEQTEFLRMEGFSTYYEACLHVKNDKWRIGTHRMNGEYVYKGKQFISTPSIADIKRKVCLIKKYNLKGANFWTMDYDDFNDICGCGSYPLLKTLNKELLGKGNYIKCVI